MNDCKKLKHLLLIAKSNQFTFLKQDRTVSLVQTISVTLIDLKF
jgi:hypothetical protein